MNIQEKLHNYIVNNAPDKFTLPDVEKSLTDIPGRMLEDHLEESLYLFISSSKNTEEKYYIPRNNFFHKAKFKIVPTAAEIKKGILFSGHRFIPFYPQELYPTESFQIKSKAGSLIKTKNIKNKLEDLYPYYSLLGAEGIIDNLTADHIDNIELIGNPSQKVNITVFDFADFYDKYSFSEGMTLMFTVENWNSGKFSVEIDNDIVENEEKNKWFEILEEGLFKQFEDIGPYLEIPEQLAIGYYNSGTSILKSPPCSIDEFINENEKIQVQFHENNTILWYPEELTPQTSDDEDLVSISQGTIESLDTILEELGLLISSVEIEAFVRDSLLAGNNSLTSVQHRIFPDSEIKFKDQAQEVAFYNHLDELWEDIISEYDPELDSKNAHLRREILNNLEELYNQFYSFKEQNKNYNLKSAASNKDLRIIRKVLDTLSQNQSELDPDDAEQLNDIVYSSLHRLKDTGLFDENTAV